MKSGSKAALRRIAGHRPFPYDTDKAQRARDALQQRRHAMAMRLHAAATKAQAERCSLALGISSDPTTPQENIE